MIEADYLISIGATKHWNIDGAFYLTDTSQVFILFTKGLTGYYTGRLIGSAEDWIGVDIQFQDDLERLWLILTGKQLIEV